MPGRNVPAVSAFDLSDIYFIEPDQNYLLTDDVFSDWNDSKIYPERFSYIPRDRMHSTASYNGLHISKSTQQSSEDWCGTETSISPFTQSGGFKFCETHQGFEHCGTQDDKTTSTRLCDNQVQTTTSLPTCNVPRTPIGLKSLKRESRRTGGMDVDMITLPKPRKRGRPRINRNCTSSSSTSSSIDPSTAPSIPRRPACVPHKQVERKYREGLNSEMERLRRAVPTLLQSAESCGIGTAKPSKGMVLAAAIAYILKIERERDEAVEEVERLGGKA
ncbi:hypothetical protein BKA63DRAFT_591711 [Paraphoma chrysanthemicola]|nr:hypothetical protein BKA63DRAFT_591711 [Paraphoma chrysanthemicola]